MKILENNISNELKIKNENNLEIKQNNFLETNIGKIINTALNVGLRFILPDLIEDEVIEVKDTIMEEGLKEGLNKAIKEGINLGKSAIGIFTGKFDNINQMQNAVKNGGIIDNVSDLIDKAVTSGKNKGKIPSTTATMIKKGKNTLLDNMSSNIESMMTDQVDLVEKLNNYSKEWNNYYNNKDFEGMEKEYSKIKNTLNKIAPLEKTINEAKKIENIHNLIKNNGKNFNISEEELKLAEVL